MVNYGERLGSMVGSDLPPPTYSEEMDAHIAAMYLRSGTAPKKPATRIVRMVDIPFRKRPSIEWTELSPGVRSQFGVRHGESSGGSDDIGRLYRRTTSFYDYAVAID